MKYTNNHPEKFKSWIIPFGLGLMQSSMILLIELVNLINICAQENIMDAVMNYVALAVIADFDDIFVMATQRNGVIMSLLENSDLLIIERTTSSQCLHKKDAVIK